MLGLHTVTNMLKQTLHNFLYLKKFEVRTYCMILYVHYSTLKVIAESVLYFEIVRHAVQDNISVVTIYDQIKNTFIRTNLSGRIQSRN